MLLRWDDCDTNKEIIDYEMRAHVFGGASLPPCSNFAIRKTASDNRNVYASDVTKILEINFYVDYILKSFETGGKGVFRKGIIKRYTHSQPLPLTQINVPPTPTYPYPPKIMAHPPKIIHTHSK